MNSTWRSSWSSLAEAGRQGRRPYRQVQDATERNDSYVELHRRAVNDAPRLMESDNAVGIKATQDALAAKIRVAHARGKHLHIPHSEGVSSPPCA